MASRDGSTGRPPGGTESNAIIQSPTIRAFPDLPDDLNHSKPDGDGSKTNQSMASATDYLKSMTMNGWSKMLHSEENEAYLLDLMINEATEALANRAEPFKEEVENFIATQLEIDAMVSNIPTPKSKHNKNLIPMFLLLMHTINGIITNRPLVAPCDSGSSHCMFNNSVFN